MENIINKDVPILYSMQISKTDLGMAFAKYFNNTTVPSTYLVNDNLEIIDHKNITPDKWFYAQMNKDLVNKLLGKD